MSGDVRCPSCGHKVRASLPEIAISIAIASGRVTSQSLIARTNCGKGTAHTTLWKLADLGRLKRERWGVSVPAGAAP